MIIASISFREGKLEESDSRSSMELEDIKKTLAYAFLYDFTVNVYTDREEYTTGTSGASSYMQKRAYDNAIKKHYLNICDIW